MKTTKLKKKYSDTELAESFVFRTKVAPEEQTILDRDLAAARNTLRDKTTSQQRNKAALLQLRFQMEDELQSSGFDAAKSFAVFLRRYIKLNYTAYKDFASDIGINVTELSQILNNHRSPSENTIIRLELHSNNFIPAKIWFRLLEKERLHELESNMLIREREAQYVKRKLKF